MWAIVNGKSLSVVLCADCAEPVLCQSEPTISHSLEAAQRMFP